MTSGELASLLRASDVDPGSVQPERLEGRLPAALIGLEDDIELRESLATAPISEHPALYALAAEGLVKHGLAEDELIDYLIAVITGEQD